MPTISIDELRDDLPKYVDRAAAGEEIAVLRAGEVVVRLVGAVDGRAERRAAARAALVALRATAVIGDLTSPIDADWDAAR